jgi:hypothetical protein
MRFYTSIILLVVFKATAVFAMTLDWSGGYRFEWTQVDRPSLGDPSERKAYGLNYMYLSPKVTASDGIDIVSRFDILNSTDAAYQNSQVGNIWGAGLPTSPATDGSRRNTTSKTQNAMGVMVSQLYMHMNQEYGSLLVGRAPIEFGVGMTYSAGTGAFDHWYDTRDLVAYKFIIGNFHVTPMIGRVYDADYWQGNSIQDQILEFGYDAPDSGSTLAVLVEKRSAPLGVNDTDPTRILAAPTTGTVISDYSTQRTNFLLGKQWSRFGFKIEGSFLTGDTGIQTSTGEFVKINAYGIATEWYFPNPESKFEWNIRAGMATGDDPTTADYEGFQFDRNYDVAFLLFNHRMGQRDFLTTGMIKDNTSGRGVSNSVDDEAIGNAMYISPKVKYAWNDKWDVSNSFTYGQAWVNPTNASDFNKQLGWEYDLEALYKPRQKVQWLNRFGYFQPGDAFQNGRDKLGNSGTYGFESKIAITF